MARGIHTSSIRGTFQRTLRRSLIGSAAILAACIACFALVHLKVTQERAKQLLLHEVEGLSVAGIMNQDVLSIEKEVNRFIESWTETQPVNAEIEVHLDQRMIAKAGKTSGWPVFHSPIQQESDLPNGTTLRVLVTTDSTGYWAQILTFLLLGELILGAFFLFLARSLDRSATRIVAPLDQTVEWIENIASALPASLDSPYPKTDGELREVQSLGTSIQALLIRISVLQTDLSKTQVDKARVEVAEQVGHDLKTLLATIELRLGKMAEFDDERRRSVRDALSRIRGVIESLKKRPETGSRSNTKYADLSHSDTNAERPEAVLLAPLLEKLVHEKNTLVDGTNSSITIGVQMTDAATLAACIDPHEFQRSISNLIDNSIDAIGSGGRVVVELGLDSGLCVIRVIDNGCGIPADVMSRLTLRGETFGKEAGSGLGLFYARSCVEHWGGTLTLDSKVGVGTRVTLRIPRSVPSWMPEHLKLTADSVVVVLDDDLLVHDLWRRRFSQLAIHPAVEYFANISEFVATQNSRKQRGVNATYLLDYELGDGLPSGLDLAERYGISRQTILVSGCFDRPDIAERARALGIKRMSKEWIGVVPIHIETDVKKASGKAIRHGSGDAMQIINQPAKAVSVEV